VTVEKSTPNTYIVFSAIGKPSSFCVFNSLKKFKQEANVLVITSKSYAKTWKEEGIQVQTSKFNSLSSWRKFLRKFLIRSKLLRNLITQTLNSHEGSHRSFLMPPHNARHFEYLHALERFHDDDWVFLVDSRDLIFQEPPSEIAQKLAKEGDLHVFDEGEFFFKTGERQLNGRSPANWNWALQLRNYDIHEITTLKDENILNSGCIVGRVSSLKGLLKLSCETLSNSKWSSFALLDQASLNFVAYSTRIRPHITFNANGRPVLNMCGVTQGRSEIRSGELFLDNLKVPIVHQFDRFGSWNEIKGFEFDKRKYEVQTLDR
jgi:hypothetical protein